MRSIALLVSISMIGCASQNVHRGPSTTVASPISAPPPPRSPYEPPPSTLSQHPSADESGTASSEGVATVPPPMRGPSSFNLPRGPNRKAPPIGFGGSAVQTWVFPTAMMFGAFFLGALTREE